MDVLFLDIYWFCINDAIHFENIRLLSLLVLWYNDGKELVSNITFLFPARGKKKKKIKKLLPLLLLLKLKMAALIPLFLGIIAFVAVKAVFLGKIAFAMSAFSLIRKLLAKKGGSSGGASYAAPQHHDDHGGYSYEPANQGWSRSIDGASMAYAGQINN